VRIITSSLARAIAAAALADASITTAAVAIGGFTIAARSIAAFAVVAFTTGALSFATAARAAPLTFEWERGDPWVRDLAWPASASAPGVAPRSVAASDPEFALHYSEIEGGPDAAWRNHEADRAREGAHATLEAGVVARAGERASLRLRPRAIASRDGARVSWPEALATLRFGAGALDVGRTRLWLGPALHGSLLLSTNAHPLDLVRLRAEGPVPARIAFFPDLRGLSGGLALAFLRDENRDFPNPHLGLLHVGSRFGSWLEVGFYRTMLFAGEGRRFRWSLDNIGGLLFADGENDPDPAENLSDQLGAVAVVARLDALFAGEAGGVGAGDAGGADASVDGGADARDGLWLYYEYAGEDNLRGLLLRNPGVSGGVRWTRGAWEAVAEFANNRRRAVPWYSHAVYSSGYTYRGVVLGHHMGGDAREIVVAAAAPLPEARRARVFAGREEALFLSRPSAANLWTLAASVEGVARAGRAALAVDIIARWGRDYPIDLLGPIERLRASARVTWRVGGGA
jgi:hypothetical protein